MSAPAGKDLEGVRAALIRAALVEDVGEGDWTTEWTVDAESQARAVVVAKESLVAAGTSCVSAIFRTLDPHMRVELAADGDRVAKGEVLARVRGSARAILTGERTALNFLGRLSGIATLTRAFVDAVQGTSARILDTRKTTPGWRALEKAAVRAGGGFNHRMGLYDFVLVKDNHVAAAGGITEAVRRVRAANHRDLPVEVEAASEADVREALKLRVPRLLLDNFSPEALAAVVGYCRRVADPPVELEASGNVTLENVRQVAETGVDFISVGALTHSAPMADVSLRVEG